jgi:hypothetical protein
MSRPRLPGSASAHASLLAATVTLLRMNGVPCSAVNQVPQKLADGRWRNLGASNAIGDVVACLPPTGRLACLEVKSGGSRVRREQRSVADAFAAAGALCVTVRSVDDVTGLLREHWRCMEAAGLPVRPLRCA